MSELFPIYSEAVPYFIIPGEWLAMSEDLCFWSSCRFQPFITACFSTIHIIKRALYRCASPGAGKVTTQAVSEAHQKDLAIEKKYGVKFIKYWVDEAAGNVYCLSSAPNAQAIRSTHEHAHGLLPDEVYKVTPGKESRVKGKQDYFLDVHEFGPGNVAAKDVAAAHKKDLAVQQKRGVKFINYWVDEKEGIVMCLATAPDSSALIETHREAHGLVPVKVMKVNQGQ